MYDAIGKVTAVADCLESQFKPNETDDQFRDHYRLVRQGVKRFRNTSFDSSDETVPGNVVRKVIKNV
jgi:hypothetical protein